MLLYDSLTRQKVELPPPPGPIRMYVCGPTVYQRIHIGNARPYIIFLWLKRWLVAQGYDAKLVENITDINDKIYAAAAQRKLGSAELAAEATRWYIEDTDDLGLERPDVEPLATETIPEIVALISELVDRGLAYESSGDVYYRVGAFPDYGRLSGADPDEMVAQEPSDLKEDPRDFALWKANKAHEDTSWESPWGKGRPGWHIECSAMAEKHLGPEFEIHGGGLDLRFPHHENEIAQSRGAGRPFAHMWAHNGMLQLDEEKMSKSTGNIVSLREVLDRYGPEAILVYFLGAHYRSPIDYSDAAMEAASSAWQSFVNAFRVPPPERPSAFWEEYVDALEDDFNTPKALSILHEWRRDGKLGLLLNGLATFGLRPSTPKEVTLGLAEEKDIAQPITPRRTPRITHLGAEPPSEVVALVLRRHSARERGDFAAADAARSEMEVLGYKVEDLADGYVVSRLERERHRRLEE